MVLSLSKRRVGPQLRFSRTWVNFNRKDTRKKALHLSVNVFSKKVLIRDTIFTSPTGDGTAILRGHTCHAKVQLLAGQLQYLNFSIIF